MTTNSIKHPSFIYTQLNGQTVLFHTIQPNISTRFKCKTVLLDPSGATTPSQSGPGSNGHEGVHYIPQSSKTGVLLSDGLLYPGHSLGESYPSAGMQSIYSIAPADWALKNVAKLVNFRVNERLLF